MPLTIAINEKLTCPKRHHFDPRRDFQSFHATCAACHAMYSVWLREQALMDAIRRAKEAAKTAGKHWYDRDKNDRNKSTNPV